MQGHAVRHFALAPAVAAMGLFVCWLGLSSSFAPMATACVLIAAFALVLYRPLYALYLVALTRFSLEMAWNHEVWGIGLLDLLGAGIPAVVAVFLLLARPRLAHLPLVRPVIGWVVLVWSLAILHLLAGGDPLATTKSAFKFTSGCALFVLAAVSVDGHRDGLRLIACWILGTLPVAITFFRHETALEYHGVQRLHSVYHDPGTPAVVASLGLLACITAVRSGLSLGWNRLALVLTCGWAAVLGRMLFVTFSGAATASTFAALFVLLAVSRRWGLLLVSVVLFFAFLQLPSVQQRWWREASILEGTEEAVAFASGRPHRWERFLERHGSISTTEKIVGVHGAWGNPENGFLQIWIDLGPVGAAATLLLLAAIAYRLMRWRREDPVPERRLIYDFTFAVACGYGAAWITASPLTWVNLQWFLWSCIGVCASMRAAAREKMDPPAAERHDAELTLRR